MLEKRGGGYPGSGDSDISFNAAQISYAIFQNNSQADNIRNLCSNKDLFTTKRLSPVGRSATRGHTVFSVNLNELDLGLLLSSFKQSIKLLTMISKI